MRKSVFTLLPAISLVFVSAVAVYTGIRAYSILHGGNRNDTISEHLIPVSGDALNVGNFLNETTYDGSLPVDEILFTIPFRKSDLYVSNRKLSSVIGTDGIKNAESSADEFVSLYLGTGYHKMNESRDALSEKLKGMLPESGIILDNGTWLSSNSFTDAWAGYISDNRISIDVKFDTADCLVFEDGYIYVRGKLTSDSFTSNAPDDNSLMPYGFSLLGRHSYVLDISMKKNENGGFIITGWSIPAEVET